MYIRIPRRHRLVISVNAPSHYAVADATRPLRAKYAAKCDADLIEVLDDAHPQWGMANKWRIQRYAEQYYQTFYVDGDVIIQEDAPNIFEAGESYTFMFRDELPTIRENFNSTNGGDYEKRLKMTARKLGLKTPTFSPNAGIMVIPQNLVNLYHPPQGDVRNDWCLDQFYLAALLMEHQDKITFLSEEYHLMYIQKDFWTKLPNSKIIHLNGSHNHGYRLELTNRIISGNFDFFLPDAKIWLPPWPELKGIKK